MLIAARLDQNYCFLLLIVRGLLGNAMILQYVSNRSMKFHKQLSDVAGCCMMHPAVEDVDWQLMSRINV